MSREICDGDTCISPKELEGLRERLATAIRRYCVAESARDEARKACECFKEGLLKVIKEREDARLVAREVLKRGDEIVIERDKAEAERDEVMAGAAQMRRALEAWRDNGAMPISDKAVKHWAKARRLRDAALSSQAGRDFLERYNRGQNLLTRVLAKDSPCDKCTVPHTTCKGICYSKVLFDDIDAYLKRGESRG